MTKKDNNSKHHTTDGLHDSEASVDLESQHHSENTQVITIDINDIRMKGGIEHLNLPKEIHDDLMQQLIADGVLTTH